jgi:hypothetical protein
METQLSVDTRLRSVYGRPNIRSTCIRLTLEDPGPFSLSCSIGWDLPEQLNQAAAIMGYHQPKPRHHCYSFVLAIPRMVPAGFHLTIPQLNGLDIVNMGPYSLVYMSRRSTISSLARQVDASHMEPNVDLVVIYMQRRMENLFYWVNNI